MEGETTVEEERKGEATPPGEGPPLHLEYIETYRRVAIYHLLYDRLTVLDLQAREEEARIAASVPEERFALVISLRNLKSPPILPPEARDEEAPAPEATRKKVRLPVAAVRYAPGSLTLMIRTMASNLYLRSSLGSEMAPDYESALRAVRRGIDRLDGGR